MIASRPPSFQDKGDLSLENWFTPADYAKGLHLTHRLPESASVALSQSVVKKVENLLPPEEK